MVFLEIIHTNDARRKDISLHPHRFSELNDGIVRFNSLPNVS